MGSIMQGSADAPHFCSPIILPVSFCQSFLKIGTPQLLNGILANGNRSMITRVDFSWWQYSTSQHSPSIGHGSKLFPGKRTTPILYRSLRLSLADFLDESVTSSSSQIDEISALFPSASCCGVPLEDVLESLYTITPTAAPGPTCICRFLLDFTVI